MFCGVVLAKIDIVRYVILRIKAQRLEQSVAKAQTQIPVPTPRQPPIAIMTNLEESPRNLERPAGKFENQQDPSDKLHRRNFQCSQGIVYCMDGKVKIG